MAAKYEMTDETREHDGRVLRRIRALRAIPQGNVMAGDLGGWIAGEANLSHVGECWVSGDAWEASPLCIQGTMHAVTTCSRTEIAVGCQVHAAAHWLSHYREIGERYGYTPLQIEEYGEHIRYAAAWLERLPRQDRRRRRR
jgi:hypothetical protein